MPDRVAKPNFMLECVRGALSAIKSQRGTILISTVAMVALSMPPATREVYRILAEDHRSQWQQIALGYATFGNGRRRRVDDGP